MIKADTDAPVFCFPPGDARQDKPGGASFCRDGRRHDRVAGTAAPSNAPAGVDTNGSEQHGSDFCAVLLAIASHDLRQPLQVIIGAQEMLAQRFSAGGPEQTALARIERAAAQLGEGLAMLADALHLRHGAGGDHFQPIALDAVLSAIVPDLSERARRKGLVLRVLSARLQVLSHPVLLGGILRNLIGNAVDYTPAGGRVLVACRRRGPTVYIEVRDNGVGMPAEHHANVFRAFRRADATRTNGLGLGLFIVKHAAEHLGHRVELYSAVGRGSRFIVIADAPEAAEARHRSRAISQPEEA
jgi:signal transduction histidine kinase